ncbi:hypothetical protein Ahy_A07g034911 [Arachis hypogaea]|uniref:Replication protein A 70 kDa DNA-binding subunit B/D first OB fold domain-containing protein n=1 Tax=Arachis hypogaea TaxID=3818 RepID=A0A445CD26_ARAHY|nr:hypothetical protein Ahy_A07g034911 [Arachis hypogaea]
MAGIHIIANINPTIDNLCVRIRVIWLWTLPSYENSPLSYSIEMVCLDEDGEKIHASVKKALVSRFVNLLEEGISYQIIYFGVGLNKGYFKTTHHEYVVNLNQRTDVHRPPESSSIPRYGFKFMLLDILLELKVKKFLKKIYNKSTKKIMECALFGNYAHKLNTFLRSGNKDGAVVVLQFERLFYKILCMAQRYSSILKIQIFVRFEELRNNIDGIPNEAAFLQIYQGKTIEQLKELDMTSGTANVNATVFNKEAKQVLGKRCVEILDPLLLKGDLSDTPTLLLNLIDKTFLFIVEVQISDNPHFSPSYKVKKMADNMDLINKFKEAHHI